jgi:hypothetical protein
MAQSSYLSNYGRIIALVLVVVVRRETISYSFQMIRPLYPGHEFTLMRTTLAFGLSCRIYSSIDINGSNLMMEELYDWHTD